jgi:DNA-binding transcriptional ArsR family regulator
MMERCWYGYAARSPQIPAGWSATVPGERPLPLRRIPGDFIYNHMVVRSDLRPADVDRIFRALADATRRDIVARSLTGVQSVSTLAARYDMSFAAVQKHVAVLERAGLIAKERSGRERLVRGNPTRIAHARDLLTKLERLWKSRFSQLDDVLAESTARE